MAGAGAVVILRRATIGDDGVEESDPVVVIVVVWLLLAAGETKKFGNFICKLVKSDGDAGATGVVSDIEWSPKRVNTGTLANCSVGIRICRHKNGENFRHFDTGSIRIHFSRFEKITHHEKTKF